MSAVWVVLGFIVGNFCWWEISKSHKTPAPTSSVAAVKNAATDCEPVNHNIPCVKYVKSYDGDTFTIEVDAFPEEYKNWQVRVRGIDTPEMKGKTDCEKDVAEVAKEVSEDMLKHATTITLKNVGKDKYFRLLADVDVDGKNLATELKAQKLGYDYDGGTKSAFSCPTTLPGKAGGLLQNVRSQRKAHK